MDDINEKDYSEELNIGDIVKILKKRIKLIIIITLLFSLTSGIISFYVITPKYKTESSLFVGKEKGNIGETMDEIDTYITFILTYVEIIKTKPVISDALNNNNIDISPEKVLANLKVTSRGETQIMDVEYVDEDPDRAFKVINAVTNEFLIKAKKMMPNGNLQILEPAEEVYSPFTPNKKLNIMIATVLGMMVSIGLAFLLEFMNNTYVKEEDVENDLDIPVLGKIPLMQDAKYRKKKGRHVKKKEKKEKKVKRRKKNKKGEEE